VIKDAVVAASWATIPTEICGDARKGKMGPRAVQQNLSPLPGRSAELERNQDGDLLAD